MKSKKEKWKQDKFFWKIRAEKRTEKSYKNEEDNLNNENEEIEEEDDINKSQSFNSIKKLN